MRFNNKFKNNSFFSILDQGYILFINFFLSILLARNLGAESLGQYAVGLSIVGLIGIFTNFGIIPTMNRKIAINSSNLNLYLGNALGIKFLISFPILLIITFIITRLLNYNNNTSIIIFLIAFYNLFITSTAYIGASFVQIHKNNLLLKLNFFVKNLILFGSIIILYLGYGLIQLLIYFIIISFIGLLYALILVRNIHSDFKIRFDIRIIPKYIIISIPLVFAGAAEFVNLKIDNVLISFLIDETHSGYYSASFNIFMAICLIPLAITKVYFPNFIKQFHENKFGAFKFLNNIRNYFVIYCCFFGLILYYLSEFIIINLYSESFLDSVIVLRFLSFALIPIILNRLYNYTLIALKQNKYYFKITAFGSLINISLNILLIPEIGILGAVVATIFTELFILVGSYIKIRKLNI